MVKINAEVTLFRNTILKVFKNYMLNNRFRTTDLRDFVFLTALITELNELMFSTKTLYYENLAKKLENPLLKFFIKVLKNLKTFFSD